METLPTKREEISPFVRGSDIEYVQAYYGTALSKLSMDDAIKRILQVINKAFVELGKSPAGTTKEERKKHLMLMAKLVLNDAKLYFPKVTIEELELAISRGIRNEFGEYFGLNVISVHKFMEGFIESEERKASLERQRRFVESLKPTPAPTEEEIAKIMSEGFELCRQEYFEKKWVRDYGNVNFQYAVDNGWINLTPEEKWELYYLAEKIVQTEIMQEETTIHHIITRKLQVQDNTCRIVWKAKDLALKRYFDMEYDMFKMAVE